MTQSRGELESHQPAALLQRGLLGLLEAAAEYEVPWRLKKAREALPSVGGTPATTWARPVV